MAVGGQDVICVKQNHSSTISASELKLHLEDLGDILFSDGRNLSPLHRKGRDGKNKVREIVFQLIHNLLFFTLEDLWLMDSFNVGAWYICENFAIKQLAIGILFRNIQQRCMTYKLCAWNLVYNYEI